MKTVRQSIDFFQDPRGKLEVNAGKKLLEIAESRSFQANELVERREAVSQLILQNSSNVREANFQSISNEDLGALFHAIDENFFDGLVSSVCEGVSHKPLRFRLSTRMTSTGGTTTMRFLRGLNPQRHFEIAIATTPLFETFRIETSSLVGGLACSNRLDALQRIMEHEMVHLVEMLLWNSSSCSRARFQKIIKRIFGHTESKHRMLTPREVAQKRIGVSLGDTVSFETQGRRLQGTVNRISKRATVLVPTTSTRGVRFNDGNFYLKYYVPLNRLRPVR